jgi:hypothetical protein
MPSFNLLIFPLIGGYYILIRSELFRYRQQRLEPQKLIFNSILAGIFLIVASYVITGLVSHLLPGIVKLMKAMYPVRNKDYFGTCIGSFFLAVAFSEISNILVQKEKRISLSIDSIGNEFERLCKTCYENAEMIQLTLKNDKSYVGWMKSLPIPTHSNYISILPVYSGYRTKDTKELIFTTQYLDVYASYIRDGDVLDIRDLTTQVIKIDEIVTANKFDQDMYDRFSAGMDDKK